MWVDDGATDVRDRSIQLICSYFCLMVNLFSRVLARPFVSHLIFQYFKFHNHETFHILFSFVYFSISLFIYFIQF